ncbi:MAG: hypothetical protein KatS3mg059_0720 [Thermomicrobiales bacterium]|nr:MAG: hypothetical protein KatS3mg059_0720 [Thermomicrobiales bacterium]
MSEFIDRVAVLLAHRENQPEISRRGVFRKLGRYGLGAAMAVAGIAASKEEVGAEWRYCNVCRWHWWGWGYDRRYCFFSDYDGHFVAYNNESCTFVGPHC